MRTILLLGIFLAGILLAANKWVIREDHPGLNIRNNHASLNNQPFTGIIYGQYAFLKPSFIKTFREGELSGYLVKWYQNQQLYLIQEFTAGKPNGTKRAWHPDGKPKFKIEYKMGEAIGETWAWHSNGLISNYIRYGSRDESAYKSWTGVGKPFYNYVLGANGRIGMNGGQFCKILTPSRREYLRSLSQQL